jgi:excisionase family DNA binding protein
MERPEETHMEKLSYQINEAVEATGYSRSRLYDLMKAGELKYVRNGTRRIIPRSELERLLSVET